MKPKLEDVARKSGVSIATVSRVLNNHPVKEETRIKVEEAIEKLGYRPNLQARAMKKGRHNRVGVIITDIENPYSAILANAISKRLIKSQIHPTFVNVDGSESHEEEGNILQELLDSGIDGIILADADLKSESSGYLTSLSQTFPVVNINSNPLRRDLSNVMADQAYGTDIAMDHLFERGHRDIAYMRGGNFYAFDVKEKIYRQKMKDAGLTVKESRIIHLEDVGHGEAVEEACQKITHLLREVNRPTAVFCSNELMSLGVYKAARKLKLSIPEDLSIVGQDNTYISQMTYPELTTIDIKPRKLGHESAEMLLQIIDSGDYSPRKLIFYPELVVRESTAPLQK